MEKENKKDEKFDFENIFEGFEGIFGDFGKIFGINSYKKIKKFEIFSCLWYNKIGFN